MGLGLPSTLHQGYRMGVAGVESHVVVEVRIGQHFIFSLKHFSFHKGECRVHISGMLLGQKVYRQQLREESGFCINACWAFRGVIINGTHFSTFTVEGGKKSTMFLPPILIHSVINLKWKLISLLSLTNILEQRGCFNFLTGVLIYSPGH